MKGMADNNVTGSVSGWQAVTGKEIRVGRADTEDVKGSIMFHVQVSSKLFPAICEVDANVPISQMNTLRGSVTPSVRAHK